MYKFIIVISLLVLTSSTLSNNKTNLNIETLSKKDLLDLPNTNEKVWIYAWASWCRPCIEKLPDLVKLSKRKDLTIYFVSIEKDGSKCHSLLTKNGFDGISYQLNPKEFKHKRSNKVQAKLKKIFGVKNNPNFGCLISNNPPLLKNKRCLLAPSPSGEGWGEGSSPTHHNAPVSSDQHLQYFHPTADY